MSKKTEPKNRLNLETQEEYLFFYQFFNIFATVAMTIGFVGTLGALVLKIFKKR
ncbi:hypothetical protein [Mycoplasmopsis pullorum]|nr:hypothetical protein [Mycoplasmopsis pullorum]